MQITEVVAMIVETETKIWALIKQLEDVLHKEGMFIQSIDTDYVQRIGGPTQEFIQLSIYTAFDKHKPKERYYNSYRQGKEKS